MSVDVVKVRGIPYIIDGHFLRIHYSASSTVTGFYGEIECPADEVPEVISEAMDYSCRSGSDQSDCQVALHYVDNLAAYFYSTDTIEITKGPLELAYRWVQPETKPNEEPKVPVVEMVLIPHG